MDPTLRVHRLAKSLHRVCNSDDSKLKMWKLIKKAMFKIVNFWFHT